MEICVHFQDSGRRTLYARCGWFDQKNVRVVRWRVKDEETFYEMLWELMEAVPVAKREEEQSGFEEVFRTQKFSSVLVLDGQGIRME